MTHQEFVWVRDHLLDILDRTNKQAKQTEQEIREAIRTLHAVSERVSEKK